MPTFTTQLLRFYQLGEKTGWTYLIVPKAISDALKPGQRTSFRVKGRLDTYPIAQVALIPMGQNHNLGDAFEDGCFIMAVNASMRKALQKEAGTTLHVELLTDDSPLVNSEDLLICLSEEPAALAFFETLTPGHQRYYSRWIDEAKTIDTKTKRIAQAIQGFAMGMGYPEMIRYFKAKKE